MSDPDKGKIIPQRPEREQQFPPSPDVRPGADTEPSDDHLGGTEKDVQPTTPPSADTQRSPAPSPGDDLDPQDELTPG